MLEIPVTMTVKAMGRHLINQHGVHVEDRTTVYVQHEYLHEHDVEWPMRQPHIHVEAQPVEPREPDWSKAGFTHFNTAFEEDAYECSECLAIVSDWKRHHEWHTELPRLFIKRIQELMGQG